MKPSRKLNIMRVSGVKLVSLVSLLHAAGIRSSHVNAKFYRKRFLKEHGLKIAARLPYRTGRLLDCVSFAAAERILAKLAAATPAPAKGKATDKAKADAKSPAPAPAPVGSSATIESVSAQLAAVAETLSALTLTVTALRQQAAMHAQELSLLVKANNVTATNSALAAQGVQHLVKEWGTPVAGAPATPDAATPSPSDAAPRIAA